MVDHIGAGVPCGCEPSDGAAGLGPLQDPYVLLVPVPSLQPLAFVFMFVFETTSYIPDSPKNSYKTKTSLEFMILLLLPSKALD